MKGLASVVLVLLILRNADSQSNPGDRAQTISNIFDIPIQTLTAISKLLQGTRPLINRRPPPSLQTSSSSSASLQLTSANRPSSLQTLYGSVNRPSGTRLQFSSYNRPNPSRSRAAKIAGLYTAPDGSGFKI